MNPNFSPFPIFPMFPKKMNFYNTHNFSNNNTNYFDEKTNSNSIISNFAEDDLLILSILFFLYIEKIDDTFLYIILFMLLIN